MDWDSKNVILELSCITFCVQCYVNDTIEDVMMKENKGYE